MQHRNVDLSHLVLTVDLWDLEGLRESNLVKHNSASPSISSVVTTSYPPAYAHSSPHVPVQYDHSNLPVYTGQQFTSPASSVPPQSPYYHNGEPANYPHANGVTYGRSASVSSASYQYGMHPSPGYPTMPGYPPTQQVHMTTQPVASAVPTMYTRNLIGSLCASAFRLKDLNGVLGIWFVLQDLSVRTEGWFRLKLTFVNISEAGQPLNTAENGKAAPRLTTGSAPVLATVFSQPFKVFSAKRFPGVIESTELSRQFAGQGIKIPIRKEGSNKRKAQSDDDADDIDGDD